MVSGSIHLHWHLLLPALLYRWMSGYPDALRQLPWSEGYMGVLWLLLICIDYDEMMYNGKDEGREGHSLSPFLAYATQFFSFFFV